MKPTWEQFRTNRSYRDKEVDLFIDVNRFGRMFIKAIRRKDYEYRTFNFTRAGYRSAVQFVTGGSQHEAKKPKAAKV